MCFSLINIGSIFILDAIESNKIETVLIFQNIFICFDFLQPYFVLFIYKKHFQKFSSTVYFIIFVTTGMFLLNIIPLFRESSDMEQEC